MSELTSLRNIGKELEKKLKAVAITTADELKKSRERRGFCQTEIA